MSLSRWAVAKRVAVPAVLAVGATASPFIQMSAAHAIGGTDSFNVHVYDPATGDDLTGMSVEVYDTATGLAVEPMTDPDDDGTYEVADLAHGTYVAKVHDPSGKHHDVYSTSATLTAGSPYGFAAARPVATGVTRGRLSGTVSQANSSGFDEHVFVFPSTETQSDIASGSTDYTNSTYVGTYNYGDPTALSDSWSLDVQAGSYKVAVGTQDCHYTYDSYGYYDGFVCDWDLTWLGGSNADTATVETVGGGTTKAIGNIALAPGTGVSVPAQISGTVTGAGGAKLDDVKVSLRAANGYNTFDYADTDANGHFSFRGAPAGTYTLEFRDRSEEYNEAWLGNKAVYDAEGNYVGATAAGAATVTITAGGATQTENAELTRSPLDVSSGAHGTMTTDSGTATRGEVEVYDVWGNRVTEASTRRDGTWSLPASDLPPGQYKIEADAGYNGQDYVMNGWYGGTSYKNAAILTVPVKGALNAGASKNRRYGSISGTLSVPRAAGTDSVHGEIDIYDAKGNHVGSDATSSNAGTYRVPSLAPGTYYVRGSAEEYNSFDATSQGVSEVDFIDQFWSNRYTLGTARAVVVTSGGNVRSVNITLSNKVSATARPTITGTAKVGKTLAAHAGSWSVLSGLSYSYTWKEGTKVISHASKYKLKKRDAGKKVTVTVTAKDTSNTYASGVATSAAKAVAKLPKKRR